MRTFDACLEGGPFAKTATTFAVPAPCEPRLNGRLASCLKIRVVTSKLQPPISRLLSSAMRAVIATPLTRQLMTRPVETPRFIISTTTPAAWAALSPVTPTTACRQTPMRLPLTAVSPAILTMTDPQKRGSSSLLIVAQKGLTECR